MTGQSCSKVSLVKVYPTGHADKAVKMYVILDEQSQQITSSFTVLRNLQ